MKDKGNTMKKVKNLKKIISQVEKVKHKNEGRIEALLQEKESLRQNAEKDKSLTYSTVERNKTIDSEIVYLRNEITNDIKKLNLRETTALALGKDGDIYRAKHQKELDKIAENLKTYLYPIIKEFYNKSNSDREEMLNDLSYLNKVINTYTSSEVVHIGYALSIPFNVTPGLTNAIHQADSEIKVIQNLK